MNSMMEYKGYHAVISYDADDNILVGTVFGISDYLGFHGSSVEEAGAMFHQSIDNYLQHCKEIGKEPNKEFKGSFNVRLTTALHKEAAMEAAREKISLNQFVAEAVQDKCQRAALV